MLDRFPKFYDEDSDKFVIIIKIINKLNKFVCLHI